MQSIGKLEYNDAHLKLHNVINQSDLNKIKKKEDTPKFLFIDLYILVPVSLEIQASEFLQLSS